MNSRLNLSATIIVSALVAAPLSVTAHHSMSEFEPRSVMLEVEGVVSKISWRNPHIMIELIHTSANGEEEVWKFEAGAVSGQRRKGLTGNEISIGDAVRIAGYPSYRRDNFMKGMHVLLPDGVELLVSAQREPRWTTNTLGRNRNVFDPERVARGDRKRHLSYLEPGGAKRLVLRGPRTGDLSTDRDRGRRRSQLG